MSGNKQQQQNNAMLQQQNQAFTSQFQNEQKQRSQEAYDRSNAAYGGAADTYGKFAATGMADLLNGMPSSAGGGGGGAAVDPRFGDVEASYRNFMGTGGVDTGAFNRFQGNLQDIGATGGWSPEQIANVNKSIAGYQNFADTGGLDAEAINRMRGLGVYDEYAKTGGLSDQAKANLRARGSSVIPAMYSQMRDEASRLGRVQGGGGPGQQALMARMARDQARGAQGAARDTEISIQDLVNQGRQWGAQGVSTSEGSLQDLLSRNKLAGLGGVVDSTANMANSIAQNRTAASSAGGGNEIGMQGLIQSGKLAGTKGLEGMAESAAARGAASSAASAADARWRASFLADNMLAGAGGLRGLRTDVPGEVALYDQNRLQSQQLWNQGNAIYNAPTKGTDWGAIANAGATGLGTYYGYRGKE